ncbi:MAG: BatD family protein [Bacteroidota bacterium]
MKQKLLASALGFILFGFVLNGQDETFTATAPSAVRVGEQFQYVVEGSERGDLRLPDLNDFQLLGGPFSSYSSHSSWVNGKMTMVTVVSYTYVLRANKAGTFTIPPSTVKVGRKEYHTNEVEIVVNKGNTPDPGATPGSNNAPPQAGNGQQDASGTGEENDPVFLRLIPSKREVYVGEQFVSGLKVYTRVNTRPASSSGDLPYEGFYKKSLDPDASAQRQDIGGQQYVSQVIQRHILIPQKSGDIVISPYESEWMVQQRIQRRSPNNVFDSFFDDPFFNSYQDVPVKLATRPLTIHVKPMPAGAPEGFSGAVGDFSMVASLSDQEIEVNEALSLKITIRGTGNLPLLGEPKVNLPPDHDLYDVTRSLNTSTSGMRISGTVNFEYPIVARHAGRFRIAPVQFAWFDPKTKQYRTASTDEFTFTVLKGESDDGSGNVYVPGVMHESVEDLGTDIRDISRNSQGFVPLATSLFAARWYRWIYPIIFLLAVLAIVLIQVVTRRNADLNLVRNRQANKMAKVRLKKADRLRKSEDHSKFYEEIGKAIWGYLSDKLNIETSMLSREVVMEQLKQHNISDSMQEELLRIVDESEFSRFAPSSEKSDVHLLYGDAVSLIRNLENKLK